jgi:tetratricopeptide (TPR) repeat protein
MRYINQLILLGGSIFLLASCSDIDKMYSEGKYITQDQVDDATDKIPERASAALSGMYAYMGKQFTAFPSSTRHDDFGYPACAISQDTNGADMVCDNVGFNWFSVCGDYSDRMTNYANPLMRYANFYNQIKLANDLLVSIDPNTDNKALQQYMGQAKAVRAFDYMSLAPYFQFRYQENADKPCVPIVTEQTTDVANNPRATVEAVYELIIKDLTDAINLLDGYTRPDKTKVDQQVAYGLRARAYLLMGKYAEAAADAEKALVGYTPASIAEVSVPSFYSLNDHNWMWGLLITNTDVLGQDGLPSWPSKLGSFSASGYATGAGIYKRINSLLWDKIPTTDVRKGWWVDENLDSPLLHQISWRYNGKNYTGVEISKLDIEDIKLPYVPYTNVKFGMKSGIGSTINDCDWPLMRVEEMILLRAEALVMSGQVGTGKQVLEDFVKTYRDPSYTVTATSPEALQTEIWKQRRIELWGEGFALVDIMRLNKPVVRIHGSITANWPAGFNFNIAAGDPWLLFRFPQSETNANSAITPEDNNEGSQPKPGDSANLLDGVTD